MSVFSEKEQAQAEALDLFAWNTGELYETRQRATIATRQAMIGSAYEPAQGVQIWYAWYAAAAERYKRENREVITDRAIRCAAVDREEDTRKALSRPLKLSDLTHAFVERDNLLSVIDFVHPITESGLYSDETLAEVRKRYPTAEIVRFADWQARKAAVQDRAVEWREVTADEYHDQLGSLPPAAYREDGFLVGEPTDHHAASGKPRYQAYRIRGGKYFASSRAMTIEEFKKL